ncbi:hypothetical protein ACF0H5_018707 [Mactra antiquata]
MSVEKRKHVRHQSLPSLDVDIEWKDASEVLIQEETKSKRRNKYLNIRSKAREQYRHSVGYRKPPLPGNTKDIKFLFVTKVSSPC